MTPSARVLSLYEGFFAGGARILHTDVVAGLHAGGDSQSHSVLSIASEAQREDTIQPMEDDHRYVRLRRAGIPVSTLGRTAGSAPPERSTFTDDELRVAADAVRDADAVLSLKEQPMGLLLALRDRGLMPDIPVIACLHRSDPEHSGAALSWLVEAAECGLLTATISCADSTSDAYAQAGARPPHRYTIPNGVDTERFRPPSARERRRARERLSIPSGAPVVVFAARLDSMKNPALFLSAVAIFARRRPQTHFVMCGAGMTRDNDAYGALVEASGISGAVHLHALGIVHDMPAIYQAADVVALTSAFGEASPLCLIEGIACGAIAVTTDVGDAARQVQGIGLVTSDRPDDIAAAWEHVFSRRSEFRAAAIAARPRLGRDRMIDEYRAAVNGLLLREPAAA